MAGKKGRSGGPRKNAGGKRLGAGRKPKQRTAAPRRAPTADEEMAIASSIPTLPGSAVDEEENPPVADPTSDAKAFLESVIARRTFATADEIRAATALLPFQHRKLGETGKKEQAKDEAGKVASRFSPAAPPRLATIGGKRV